MPEVAWPLPPVGGSDVLVAGISDPSVAGVQSVSAVGACNAA